MRERFWNREERTWVVILGPQTSGRHAHGLWRPAEWRCHVHHCTSLDARLLPERRYPDARHVTIVELPDFLRLLKLVGGNGEQARMAELDAACRAHLGHGSRPGQWRFRDHPAPGRPALAPAPRRLERAAPEPEGEREAA
jgi:hypothetical protein